MRMWMKSACVVLAWSILPIILVAVGMKGSVYPAQANTRTARSTEVVLTSMLSVAAAPVTAPGRTTRYVVHHGDTLSGIAAARFAVRGGWPALYAANRQVIGPDPDAIRSGSVVMVPGPVASSPPWPGPARRRQQQPSAPAGIRHHLPLVRKKASAATGRPQWLKIMLLAAGLFILVAFLAAVVLVSGSSSAPTAAPGSRARHRSADRRRQRAAVQALQLCKAGSGLGLGSRWPGAGQARIVLVDYDRLVVTCSKRDGTVYVLRPPGEDPEAILLVARLVLPEGLYRDLAGQLGMPASWSVE